MRCARHPNVETELRCATCGTPICPDCQVTTPVGMKCPECGLAPVPEIYRVSPGALGRAIAAGAVSSMVVGFLALFLPGAAGLLLLFLFATPSVGRMIADVAGWAAGGRRGPVLAAAAAGSCVIGILLLAPDLSRLVAGAPLMGTRELLGLLAVRPLFALFAGLCAAFAYRRLR